MNKIRLTITLVLLLLIQTNAHAAWTYVFCATPDGEDWYWLKNNFDNYVTISGQWHESPIVWGKYFKYMSVSEEDYSAVNRQCREGYVAQPADNKLSDWQRFRVYKPNGENYYAPGKYGEIIALG
ncbi:hypothetical protein [Spartinivicinus poritis]|uniref:Uncharacterized protein n=1 Tax=Spartinivicinus poritis TaxID=2994640 RepID=A0ABT5UAS4_9GAMM|nr:hypothetical protein [Spartinivicinus sp. A2-2]MDE1463462.1 hypothetical protein [Spartinivicinus sp. A2-2]